MAKNNTIEAFIESALRQDFDQKQAEEKQQFEAELPALVQKRRGAVQAAIKDDASPKRGARAAQAASSERKSFSSLSDAKREKWIGEIIEAGKAKAKRDAVGKAFLEAEGFKLRESIIDRIQHDASEAHGKTDAKKK